MNIQDDTVLNRIAPTNPIPGHDTHDTLDSVALAMRDNILSRDPTDRRTAPRSRFGLDRRRKFAVGTGALGVLVAGGVAVALGVTPPGVTRAIHSVSPPGAKVTDVRMLVEHVSPNGIRDQIWVARNSAGQTCHDERTVGPDGREDSGVGCESRRPADYPKPPTESFSGGLSAAGRPWPSLTYEVIAHTTLPTVTRIDLVYPDGQSYPLTLNPANGWAVGVVPPKVTSMSSTLVGRDKRGAIVATKRLRPTSG